MSKGNFPEMSAVLRKSIIPCTQTSLALSTPVDSLSNTRWMQPADHSWLENLQNTKETETAPLTVLH